MNQEEFVMIACAVGPMFAHEHFLDASWLSRTLAKAFLVDVDKIPLDAPDPVYHFLLSEASLAQVPFYITQRGEQ